MRRLRGEKGSALVMVMFMMLILTLLGVAVLSATVGGARRTLTRENDIQSLQLTQKTLDESVAFIAANLDGKQIAANTLKATLDGVLTRIPARQVADPTKKTGVQTDLTLASSQLISAVPTADFLNDPIKGDSSYTVTLTAQGVVNGVQRTMTQKVTVSLYPDFLNYAFGSEENLILNGAPQIKGNIYAGNQLLVSNMAQYTYNGIKYNGVDNPAQKTLFPNMLARDDGSQPLAFVQSLDRFNLSENNYQSRPVNQGADGSTLSGDLTKANVKKALNIDLSQVRIRNNEQFIRVDVIQSFREKFGLALNLNGSSIPADVSGMKAVLDGYSGALKMPEKPPGPPTEPGPQGTDETEAKYNDRIKKYEDEYKKYIAALEQYERDLDTLAGKLTNMGSTVVFNGNLDVDGDWLRGLIQTTRRADSWLIVNGDLTVNNKIDSSNLNVYGNVLVTGSVKLVGKINVDSTMFVLGNTTIQDATITGATGNKEIVLISKGPILLNRVDAFNDTAQTLRGFFYTDATAELYGVGSNFDLQGGFFAKGNLTVNAVVGSSTQDPSRQRINFDDQSVGKANRFKVNYNDEVFEHQGMALPRVDKISVKAEKIQLTNTP